MGQGEKRTEKLQLRRLTEEMLEQGMQSGREAQVSHSRRLIIKSPKWWQYILLFFLFLCIVGMAAMVCLCAGCCCVEWGICTYCGWGKKTPKASHGGEDSESEELLSDSEHHHRHKSGHSRASED